MLKFQKFLTIFSREKFHVKSRGVSRVIEKSVWKALLKQYV